MFLRQVATSLGLCTLVAEDDILVSWSPHVFGREGTLLPDVGRCRSLSRSRTCRPRWSASRACSAAPMPERTGAVPPPPRRPASSTPTLCCPGRCCSPSARPASSRTSCASKDHTLWLQPTRPARFGNQRLYLADICLNCRGCWRATTST